MIVKTRGSFSHTLGRSSNLQLKKKQHFFYILSLRLSYHALKKITLFVFITCAYTEVPEEGSRSKPLVPPRRANSNKSLSSWTNYITKYITFLKLHCFFPFFKYTKPRQQAVSFGHAGLGGKQMKQQYRQRRLRSTNQYTTNSIKKVHRVFPLL